MGFNMTRKAHKDERKACGYVKCSMDDSDPIKEVFKPDKEVEVIERVVMDIEVDATIQEEAVTEDTIIQEDNTSNSWKGKFTLETT